MIKGLITVVFLFASLLAAAPALADKRVALVIGNANYAGVTPLKNPINDATDVGRTLRELGFDVIDIYDVTKPEFDKALAEFGRRALGADVALFYYAGHAVQGAGENARNYLLPRDIEVRDSSDLKSLSIKFDSVREILEESHAVKILILDACRDNPFEQKSAMRSIGGYSASRGLGRIDRAEGTLIAYSAEANKAAMDGSGRNSPYAEALMRRLREPGVELEAMFKHVRADVVTKTDGVQQPDMLSRVVGDFYLTPLQNDRIAWDAIKLSEDAEALTDFIKRFPNSIYALRAQAKLDLFEHLSADEEKRRLAEERGRRDEEQKQKQRAELCARERRDLDALNGSEDVGALEALRARAACQAVAGDVDAALQRARMAVEQRIAKEKLAEIERRRKEEDAERKRVADLCASESAALANFATSINPADVEAFRARALCPTIGAAIDDQLKRVRRAAEEKLKTDARVAKQDEIDRRAAEARAAAAQQQAADELDRKSKQQAEEQKRQQIAEICAREKTELESFAGSTQAETIEAFGRRATCTTLRAAIDARIARARKDIAALCKQEARDFAAQKFTDAIAARKAADALSCADARETAMTRVAQLEDETRRQRETCAADDSALQAIDVGAFDSAKQLTALRDRTRCDSVRGGVAQALAKIEQRARAAQQELARVDCYRGKPTGQIDDATRAALKSYALRKSADPDRLRLDDDLVSQLKGENPRLCAPVAPVVARPAPESPPKTVRPVAPPREQHRVARLPREEEDVPTPRKEKQHKERAPVAREPAPRPRARAVADTQPAPTHVAPAAPERAPAPRPSGGGAITGMGF
jgi:hypothetical protein